MGRLIIGRYARRTPPARARVRLREQQRELEGLIGRAGARATERVQIRRLRGLEESSTNYSLAMVADHLARVNRDVASVVRDLARGQRSPIAVNIAAYKPSADAETGRALADLDASIVPLQGALEHEEGIATSSVTHAHPWFGELPARVWACFGPFHQDLHLAQARAIAEGLGV